MAQNLVTIVTVLKSLWNSLNWWKITNYSLMLIKKWFFLMYTLFSFFSPVIRFFSLVAVYLIGGVLFQIFVRKNSGKNAIPNASFWLDFPALVKVCWFIIVNNVYIVQIYHFMIPHLFKASGPSNTSKFPVPVLHLAILLPHQLKA